jgi:hypothetical protein
MGRRTSRGAAMVSRDREDEPWVVRSNMDGGD